MKLKTYQAWTMSEALAFVKKDLGADAVILHTRTFERGGFFGFGRKAVVEITAARAADMPRGETRVDSRFESRGDGSRGEAEKSPISRAEAASAERRSAPKTFKTATLANVSGASATANAPLASGRSAASGSATSSGLDRSAKVEARGEAIGEATGEAIGEVVQLSAAARAYGATSASGGFGAPGGRGEPQRLDRETNRDLALDMDVEREKTRRLAQAMAIQLEKQSSERANAARNERATGNAVQAAQAAARNNAAAAGSPASVRLISPESGVVTTEPVGPAQRFVLVPEVRAIGGSSGGAAATGARLQTLAVTASPMPMSPVDAVAEPRSATPTIATPTIATPTIATPTSRAASPLSPEATRAQKFDVVPSRGEPVAATERGELDTISAFVGRFLGDAHASVSSSVSAERVRPSIAHTISPSHVEARAVSQVRSMEATRSMRASRPATLEAAYARLIEQEVAQELADRILATVEHELAAALEAGVSPSEVVVREAMERQIAKLLPEDATDGFRMEPDAYPNRVPGREGNARRIAFVGPTGVGKTTTLAKIAAQLSLKRGLKVGIVAADTYRIAAVDQLRTYAEILGIAVEVASSPTDAARACERLGDVDVILIDTAGRSQNDRMKLSELRAFLAAAQPDETHLVLSATAGARTLAREAESFGALGVDRLVLTKLDEAASFGTLISLVERLGTRVSFLTHGQEVPEHIETARGRRLASLVMGSEVR